MRLEQRIEGRALQGLLRRLSLDRGPGPRPLHTTQSPIKPSRAASVRAAFVLLYSKQNEQIIWSTSERSLLHATQILALVHINRSAVSLHAEAQGEPESPYPSPGPRVVEDTLRKEQPQKLA